MYKNIKIGTKISLLVISVVMVSLLTVGFITDLLNRKSTEERYYETLNAIADLKVKRFNLMSQQVVNDIKLIKNFPILKSSSIASLQTSINPEIDNFLKNIVNSYGYNNIYLVTPSGKIVYKAKPDDIYQTLNDKFSDPDGDFLAKSYNGNHFSNIVRSKDKFSFFIGSPDTLTDGTLLVVYNLDASSICSSHQDTSGLGNTGESIVGKLSKGKITYYSTLRHDSSSEFVKKTFNLGDEKNTFMQQAVLKKEGFGENIDYRGKSVIAAWRYIPLIDMGLVVKIDLDETLSIVKDLRVKIFIAGLMILIICVLSVVIFSNALVRPLLLLKEAMAMLGQGKLPNQLKTTDNDEIGEMTDTVNSLVSGLKDTATFAQKIGEGDFEARFKPMSDEDTLGVSLLQMRDSIKEAANKDDEQSWIITGLAEVGDILRSINTLDDLGDRVLTYVVKRLDAIQGAFYIVNDENEKNKFLEMTASYAYNKKKYLKATFKFAEGLVGQAAIEQDTLLRTEIPDSYMTITSGLLGDKKPKCLLVVPLITIVGSEKEVFGVIEFASFEKFNSRSIRFANEVSEIIARTIFNIKVNETTRILLEKSQKQSEELQEQQEILRQNAEEMQATQEELRRSNVALEDQVEEVNRTQKRMQLLLENASEVIVIYEKDATIRYISPSVEKILGYSPDQMIGTGISSMVNEESVERTHKFFSDLLSIPEKQQVIEISFQRKNGDDIWLEAIGTNLMTDMAISGIVVNIRDITERRTAEMESRRSGQMQALSENSLDLITRFNTEGQIFYINPVIEDYTGIEKNSFFSKNLDELTLDKSIVREWENVLKEVTKENKKIAIEMDFPSVMGKRIMQVNAIPEYNVDQLMESVLVVSHDITDRKFAELEIQVQNRKITESINYAQRIQGSILPNNVVIQRILPDSFILYKPRDVVSGDFPWFMQKGDDMFIAAVDCTGHGVPGALISLIGYFLLNNAVRELSEPGAILDELDRSVTHTLRQDSEDSTTRDGMDIALCKINLKTHTLQYAGAHRPLYVMKDDELKEIKGDKYPIGGGQYKSRGHFTTHTIDFNEGNAVFFCSDGFPDQFGGTDNRKFSSRRIREIIIENPNKSMQEMYKIFDESFENWKGNYKQTDDVLMIGIKF